MVDRSLNVLDRALSQETINTLETKGKNDQSTKAEISVRFYFTAKYKQATSDIQGKVDNIITVANQGNDNSGVLIKFKVHCIEEYSDPELSRGSPMLDAFTSYKGTVANLLGGADLAFILVSHSDDVGGMSYICT